MGEQHTSGPFSAQQLISLALSPFSEYLFQCFLNEIGCDCSQGARALSHLVFVQRDEPLFLCHWHCCHCCPGCPKHGNMRSLELWKSVLCSAQDSEPAQGSLLLNCNFIWSPVMEFVRFLKTIPDSPTLMCNAPQGYGIIFLEADVPG